MSPLPSVEPKPLETAERRQVTVMFSDLVGSTALSARMDPEDLREVISAYQKCVAETVRRFGGFVAGRSRRHPGAASPTRPTAGRADTRPAPWSHHAVAVAIPRGGGNQAGNLGVRQILNGPRRSADGAVGGLSQ